MTLGKRVYKWLPLQIGAVLVIALAMGAFVLSALERRFLNAAGETLSLAAADIADKLDLVLYERSGDVHALAKSSVRPLAAGDVQTLSANLAAVQNAYPIYLWLAVTDKNGRVVASTDTVSRGKDLSKRSWFIAARGGAGLQVENPRPGEDVKGAVAIAMTEPIVGPDDVVLGVVTAHVGLPALLDLFPRTVRIFEGQHRIRGDVEWELLNQDGSILSESAPQAEAAPNLLDLKVPSARLSLDPAARPGYVEESHGRRRVQVITGYARTNGYGPFTSPLLGVLIRENKSDVLAPIHGLLWKLGTAGSAILLPLLAMLLWTAIRLRKEWLAAVEAERISRENEARFRATFEQAAVGVAHVSPAGQWLRVNRRLCDMVGYSRDELLKLRFQDITHPDDLPLDLDHVRQMLGGEIAAYSMEKRYIRKNGSPVWINLTVSLVRDDTGAPGYFISVIEDIQARKEAEDQLRRLSAELEERVVDRTHELQVANKDLVAQIAERERAEQALLASHDLLGQIINSIPQYVFWKDRNSNYLGCNLAFARQAGLASPAEIVGKSDFELSWKETAELYRADDQKVMAVKTAKLNFEEPMGGTNGAAMVIRTSKVPLIDPTGAIFGILGIFEDITERKRTEAALREAEAKFRTLVEQPLLGFYIIGDNGRVAYTNAKLAELFGCSQRELEAVDPVSLVAEPDRERIAANIRRRLAGEPLPPTYTFKALRKDGKVIDMEVYATRAELHGRPAIIGMLRDVTELNRLEAESRRLERLATWGQLLGGIAHELKNPLFILSGHLQLFKERLGEAADPGLARDFKKIEEAAKRIVVITEHFLHLARPATSKRRHCSIRTLLENTMDALSHELARHLISSVMLVDDSLPEIWTDPKLLREVFHHLIVNAIEAMAQARGQRTLTVKAAQSDGGIDVRIQDNGCGIHLDQQTKIFEPFFTTKPPDQATGLGLWIVRSNLMVLQGSVRLESEPGKGATFIVRLPLLTEPATLASRRDGEA